MMSKNAPEAVDVVQFQRQRGGEEDDLDARLVERLQRHPSFPAARRAERM